ncbi:TIGR02234 family membrane protein [Nocardia uniformis]|uniref:TIGR02234 family membrane protein n=1 Tax=Nocardia uniformis TaxID=53432 RepID=A0A849C6T5_9NOCA|nr:TIGR02234 family membrane protein [Nocardia uniformis]NNH72055.1 TIGR02234 family membrane protein [Nocardia uniformis]
MSRTGASTPDPGASQPDSSGVDETPSGSVDPAIRAEIEAAAAADAQAAQADTVPKRPKPFAAVLLLAVSAGLLWVASRMTWVTIEVSSELGAPRGLDLNGGTWFGALTPLALALVATIAAVFATHGWPRRVVGVVVAVLAAVAAVPEYALLRGQGNTAERAGRLAELRDWEHVVSAQTATLPAVVALVGAVAAFVAGLLLVRMPQGSARMSGKYDNPAVRRAAATAEVAQQRATESGSQPATGEQLSGRVLWDALDAGDDPTVDETNIPAAHNDPEIRNAGDEAR